ncbi:hypothetical protein GGP72_000223 [Salinibacter ruber]|nr:ImmA/IrrE family metallo-endopeptidase [Salinibacter ruber]MCS3679614.1 hypothetical protein [Salinibacter ruber]
MNHTSRHVPICTMSLSARSTVGDTDIGGAPSSETGSSGEESSPTEEESQDPGEVAALSQLFRRSARYRRAEEYKQFLDFVGRFPQYSPYNAALLHVQNPGVSFTATRRQWRERFDRVPEPGARPYVILQPFGPVLFVYDLPDTEPRSAEAQELPEKVTVPFAVEGELSDETWTRTLQNCRKQEKVAVRRSANLHRRHGGQVERSPFQTGPQNPSDCLYRVVINKNLEREEQYGALAHELGHLFCGHLGTDEEAWWDECSGIGKPQKEIEAESVAYLACRRTGLHSISERYLHWHAERAAGSSSGLLPPVRLRTVLDTAGYVESMGEDGFQSKRDAQE